MIKSAIFVFLAVCCLGAAQANATLIGGNLQSDTSTSAIAKAQIANGKIDADSFNSPDLGENINSAVAVCAAAGIRCNIEVSKGGTFTTSPEVPMGFSVSFSPQGIYTLNTTFVIDHRSTTWHFNGAQFKLVMSKPAAAFYVGKHMSPAGGSPTIVTISPGSPNVIDWVSGPKFNFDQMDTVFLSNGSGGVQAGNVSTGTDTQIVLTADMKPVNEVELTGYINPPQSNGNTAGPVIYDLSVSDHSRSTNADVALVVELTTGLQVYNFYASSFTHGTCVQLLGAIETDMFGANCSQSNNGILFTVNTAGTVFASSANANRVYGFDANDGGNYAGSHTLEFNGAGGNRVYDFHQEGRRCAVCNLWHDNSLWGITIGSHNNYVSVSDDERNGQNTPSSIDYDFEGTSTNNYLTGPGSINDVSYNGSGRGNGFQYIVLADGKTQATNIHNLFFSGPRSPSYKDYYFTPGATGDIERVFPTPAASDIPPASDGANGHVPISYIGATSINGPAWASNLSLHGAGSDAAGQGVYLQFQVSGAGHPWLIQEGASSPTLDFWHFNGSGWSKVMTLTDTGGITGPAVAKVLQSCGTLTSTASPSDSLSCSWVSASSVCTITPTNSSPVHWTYYTPSVGAVTVHHEAIAGAAYGIACSAR